MWLFKFVLYHYSKSPKRAVNGLSLLAHLFSGLIVLLYYFISQNDVIDKSLRSIESMFSYVAVFIVLYLAFVLLFTKKTVNQLIDNYAPIDTSIYWIFVLRGKVVINIILCAIWVPSL